MRCQGRLQTGVDILFMINWVYRKELRTQPKATRQVNALDGDPVLPEVEDARKRLVELRE